MKILLILKKGSKLLPLIGSKKVLDFGCGNGTFIKKLSEIIGKNRCLAIEKSLNIRIYNDLNNYINVKNLKNSHFGVNI